MLRDKPIRTAFILSLVINVFCVAVLGRSSLVHPPPLAHDDVIQKLHAVKISTADPNRLKPSHEGPESDQPTGSEDGEGGPGDAASKASKSGGRSSAHGEPGRLSTQRGDRIVSSRENLAADRSNQSDLNNVDDHNAAGHPTQNPLNKSAGAPAHPDRQSAGVPQHRSAGRLDPSGHTPPDTGRLQDSRLDPSQASLEATRIARAAADQAHPTASPARSRLDRAIAADTAHPVRIAERADDADLSLHVDHSHPASPSAAPHPEHGTATAHPTAGAPAHRSLDRASAASAHPHSAAARPASPSPQGAHPGTPAAAQASANGRPAQQQGQRHALSLQPGMHPGSGGSPAPSRAAGGRPGGQFGASTAGAPAATGGANAPSASRTGAGGTARTVGSQAGSRPGESLGAQPGQGRNGTAGRPGNGAAGGQGRGTAAVAQGGRTGAQSSAPDGRPGSPSAGASAPSAAGLAGAGSAARRLASGSPLGAVVPRPAGAAASSGRPAPTGASAPPGGSVPAAASTVPGGGSGPAGSRRDIPSPGAGAHIGGRYNGLAPIHGITGERAPRDIGTESGAPSTPLHLPAASADNNGLVPGSLVPRANRRWVTNPEAHNDVAPEGRQYAYAPHFTLNVRSVGSLSENGTVNWGKPHPVKHKKKPLGGDGTGLLGIYYAGNDFDQFVYRRPDRNIDFLWTGTQPCPNMPANTAFTVRWIGQLVPPTTDTYTIMTTSDDGVRVFLDGALIISNWTIHAATEDTATVTLQAGRAYNIKVEYYEKNGMSNEVIKLYWESPHIPLQYIPETSLRYPKSMLTSNLPLTQTP